MTIDERIEALTANLEQASRDIQNLRVAQQEGFSETGRIFGIVLYSLQRLENIARVHEQRLDDLEGR